MSMNGAINYAILRLKADGVDVDAGHWQGVATQGKPDLVTREILDLHLKFLMPVTRDEAQWGIKPNLPWAEDHFQERVGRKPTNPGEEYKNWPWWRGQDEQTRIAGPTGQEPQFTHTYQERFWPKRANVEDPPSDSHLTEIGREAWYRSRMGVRYPYGDLDDVVNLLRREPQTRQAYLPIFFPEDTGAVHGGRIPCSLGYHFLLRRERLHCWYDIRSCDAVRHFRDDLYLAVRLVQWIIGELQDFETEGKPHSMIGPTHPDERVWQDVEPGTLHFKAHSFHVHKGDSYLL